MPIYNLLQSPPDPRDYVYSPRIQPHQFARAIDKRPLVTRVEDQGPAGTCGGNGFTSQCEGLAMGHGIPLHLSRMFSYTTAKKIGNRLPQDGVYMRDLYRAAYHYGLLSEEGPSSYPYDLSQQYTDPPAWAYAQAANMKVKRYEAIVSTASNMTGFYTTEQIIDRLKAALNEGFMPTIGLNVTASLSPLSGPWRQHDYQPVSQSWPSLGGHLMLCCGYDSDAFRLLVLNSYGVHRGDGGYVGLPYEICADVMFESWIVRDFNGWSIPEAPGIVLAGMNQFRIDARIIPEQDEVGQFVNVWIGATDPDGNIYLRSGEGDNWSPVINDAFPPTLTNYELQSENLLPIVNWMNLEPFAGFAVYVAYGPSLWSERGPVRVCTIPTF